jgi:hypothetical protein
MLLVAMVHFPILSLYSGQWIVHVRGYCPPLSTIPTGSVTNAPENVNCPGECPRRGEDRSIWNGQESRVARGGRYLCLGSLSGEQPAAKLVDAGGAVWWCGSVAAISM